MVDVTIATGIVAVAATVLMVLVVLFITALAMREDGHRPTDAIEDE